MAEARLTARVETKGVAKASQELSQLQKRSAQAEKAVTEAADAVLKAEKKTADLADELVKASKAEKLAAATALRLAKEEEDLAKSAFKAAKSENTFAKSLSKASKEADVLVEAVDDADKETKDYAKTAGKAAAAVAVLGAAFAALVIRQAQVERQFEQQAFLAEESVGNFKAIAFAVEDAGVSAEKFADISKDTNDKISDFVRTGGGEFKDFFETVGAEVGLTAEEMQKMSGKDTLQALKNALDEVNAPLAEQIFFFESLGNDASKLIPLLANNGEELGRLTGKFRDLNSELLLNQEQSASLRELSQEFDLLQVTGSNALTFLTARFAPDLLKVMKVITDNIPKATKVLEEFFGGVDILIQKSVISDLESEYRKLARTINKLESKTQKEINELTLDEINNLEKLIRKRKIEANLIVDRIELLKAGQEAEGLSALKTPLPEFSSDDPQKKVISIRAKEIADREAKIAQDKRERQQKLSDQFLEDLRRLGASELELIDLQEDDKLAKLKEFNQQGLAIGQEFEDAKTAITEEASKKRAAVADQEIQLILSSSQQLLGSLADLSSQFGGEQSAIFKSLFITQKAFALASTINSVAKATADAGASGLTVGEKIANIALITSQMAGLVSTIQGNNFSPRQQGGQFRAGQNLLVGEKGPEFLQFGSGGRIADAQQTSSMMSGGQQSVTIINQTSGRIDETEVQTDDRGQMIIIAREIMNREVLDPNSNFNKNLDRTRNTQRRFNNG